MILRPAQIRLMRMGKPISMCNFGGDSDSDSSVSTVNDTKNYVTSTDRRSVASDQAVSLTGDNNTVDRSTSSTTLFMDNSDRSSLTSFIDNSNRSTNFTDNSDRSTKTTTTITDFGSVNGALGGMGAMTTKAFDVVDNALQGSVSVLKQQSTDQMKAVSAAFEMARGAGNQAASNSAAVLGFASEAIQKTNSAFADAKDGGQSKMAMAVVVAAAVVGVAFALKD